MPTPWIDRVLWGIALVAIVGRFLALDHSPPGFWLDEFLAGLHLGCMSQAGQSGHGEKWPLFVLGAGGGYYTPVFLYFGMLWTKLFGLSFTSLRAMAALFVSITIAGIYLLAKRLGGPRVALWATLLASLSPWAFQFSRITWDPPLAPAFLIWCCNFWLLRRSWLGGILAGAMFAGALYSYPPTRIQAPLLFLALFFLTWGMTNRRWVRLAGFAVTSVLLVIPLLRFMTTPQFLERSSGLAIFSHGYLDQHRGHLYPILAFVNIFLDNLALHLRPSFLFFTGDPNLRHSTQMLGELGLLDDLALLFGVLLLASAIRNRAARGDESRLSPSLGQIFALAGSGILAGLVPAALTWEGLPHALRAIGAWPFFSLLGAGLIALAEKRWRLVRGFALATACAHICLFGWLYFREYPRIAGEAFNSDWRNSLTDISRLSPEARSSFARNNGDLLRFYMMRSGRYDCLQSEKVRADWAR